MQLPCWQSNCWCLSVSPSLTLEWLNFIILIKLFAFEREPDIRFVLKQTYLELIGLLYDHLQLRVFAQTWAAHLGHLLLLCTHQWLVLVGVTWDDTNQLQLQQLQLPQCKPSDYVEVCLDIFLVNLIISWTPFVNGCLEFSDTETNMWTVKYGNRL